ncbi:MAG: DNA mismatch repair endonuclease MutL [Bdellovibrionaceae bacterium]|nr:DNA mismatch repair endonuclease MutL [Pseudobdellovibrionaceae bacterium]
MSISYLNKQVIDQIAAGEVVERPAHLVKELIENSVDAGATKIEVRFENGGRDIVVQDNGQGISADQLVMALDRHSTSKISEYEDIWNLSSYGFRGEALASISAVSDFELISRPVGVDEAHKIHSKFGHKSDVTKTQLPVGTLIRVSQLFENTPVRIKFLKSSSYEHSLIKQVIKALALINYTVEFKVFDSQKLAFQIPGARTLKERTQWLFGDERVFVAEKEADGFKVEAVFMSPYDVEKNSKSIWIFAQGRWVQDKMIQSAIMEAFKNLLMHGEYPRVVLNVSCPKDFVDINIHPAKSQVKFTDSQKIFRLVYSTIERALSSGPWKEATVSPSIAPSSDFRSEHNLESLTQSTFKDPQLFSAQFQKKVFPSAPLFVGRSVETGVNTDSFILKRDSSDGVLSDESSERISTPVSGAYWQQCQVVGQVDLTYIICQGADKMVLVDQHAAHERVLFERLLNQYKMGSVAVQKMLIPISLDLEVEQVEVLLRHQEQLDKIGIQWEQTGPAAICILGMPIEIKENAVLKLLHQFINEAESVSTSYVFENRIKDFVATLACHSAIRAGQSLSHSEMEKLLRDMDEYPLSSFCPHGRPVNLEFSFKYLEREFGRIN